MKPCIIVSFDLSSSINLINIFCIKKYPILNIFLRAHISLDTITYNKIVISGRGMLNINRRKIYEYRKDKFLCD